METLSNLESFVRSAECSSFSAAGRLLALTPAAVSRNVAQLERNLGVRLFQRSTRGLTLTEAGERFLQSVSGGLDSIQSAIAEVKSQVEQPAGVLKLSISLAFGRDYLLPLMPAFQARYPAILPDWHFDNRQVNLITEGFDAAIGAGFELAPGVVARELARLHVVAVATPGYMQGRPWPESPSELSDLDGLVMRSAQTGRIRLWVMRNAAGEEMALELKPRMIANDPDAICRGVLMGMGIGVLAMPNALPHLESRALIRVLPDWYMDAGPISLYFASKRLPPAKTRAFVDFIIDGFREQKLAQRFSAI